MTIPNFFTIGIEVYYKLFNMQKSFENIGFWDRLVLAIRYV